MVREVLDTHYAMSHDAVTRQRADAVLWSETVYPTTFGQPKSLAGELLDQEILDFVDAAGVPFVIGTYERDGAGEYNSAAVVAPRRGLLGHYRKTRPFPLTESVPPWLDGPWLRRALPWTGHWRAGDGARVFPLLLADGRAAVAFSMHPVGVDELMQISDDGGIMPPKSTWFEPKLRDGLLSHLI